MQESIGGLKNSNKAACMLIYINDFIIPKWLFTYNIVVLQSMLLLIINFKTSIAWI